MKFYLPTLVYSEKHCVENHKKELADLGDKAFIVTGRHSSKANGSLDDVISALSSQGMKYAIFDEIEENPSTETVMKAANLGRAAEVDFVIGIGGGSPMDAAKAIAFMISNPGRDADVMYEKCELHDALPVAEVPTTAGTGSEITPYSILTYHKIKTKKSIAHLIYPKLALVDAKYLKTASAENTIYTAVDTLAHLVESYLNTNSDSFNRTFSMRGLELWGSVKDEIRRKRFSETVYEKLMEACNYGGMAITHTGTSLPHGLSYMLTYNLGVPHGRAVGVFLARYVRLFAAHGPEDARKVLNLLGFDNLDELEEYLDFVLGHVSVTDDMKKANVDAILSNAAKLKNYPFEVTEEELLKVHRYREE